ncbi:hypothetical protein CHKEEEPN_1206 [Methylorubrum podarium]|nr:hypothetical protein CHKEEEPN_1206 [Methylorubrum podarium]
MPTSSVHWLILSLTKAARPLAARPATTNRIATVTAGASLASGASHWISRNSLRPSSRPEPTIASAKGSAETRMIPQATTVSAAMDAHWAAGVSALRAAAGPGSSPSSSSASDPPRTRQT